MAGGVIPELDLSGQVALVTGATRSIGRATAIALAEAGADVLVSGRWEEGLDRVSAEVKAKGRRALSSVCDVTDARSVESTIEKCREQLGRLDIVIANAGIFPEMKPAEEVAQQEWDAVIATNLTGVMRTCLAAGPLLIEKRSGSIVITSSIEGHVALEGDLSYIAAKHGVVGLTRSLAVEWAKHGVRVNALCPGFVVRDDEPLLEDDEMMKLITNRTPLGRWGTAREVALAAVFLASPAASYITGTTLAVDGGWLAQ
jgi:NAD(P)-dependent dehydrogenase (short-subunit alcohol dehydrogenase family)